MSKKTNQNNWQTKKLGEVCIIKPPKSEVRNSLSDSDLVSFVPMEDLGINQKFLKPIQKKSLKEVEGSYTYFAENDVLLAKITPCFENGKLGIAKNLINNFGFGSSEYIVFRTSENLFNEFLYYFLSRETFREEGAKQMFGAVGHKRISKDFIENLLIPLPPLPEQRRIVAILDKAFAAIDKAKVNAERNLANTREVFDSYLQGVFANPGKDWEKKRLGECFKLKSGDNITSKMMVKNGQFSVYGGNGVAGYYNNYNLSGNNIIIGRVGALCGNVRHIDKNIWLTDNAFKVTEYKYKFDYNFLAYLLNFKKLRKYARQAAQPVVSNSSLEDVILKFPLSIAEQHRIVTQFDALSAETKRLEEIYRKKLAALAELKKSILQKAFAGELPEVSL